MENLIIQNDSFVKLPMCRDDIFDVTITDPPYNRHVQDNLCSGSLVGTLQVPKYNLSFDPITNFRFIGDLLGVTRRWVIVFCAVEDFGRIADQYRNYYVRGGIWYKPNSMGQLTGDRPATSYEGLAILHSTKVKKRWNGSGSFAIWQCNGTRGMKNRHPNQKPLDLCLKLTALFSDRNEVVFDPFAGSGSLGIAAKLLGRRWTGWEKDPLWVEKGNRNINECRYASHTDECALSLCTMKELR